LSARKQAVISSVLLLLSNRLRAGFFMRPFKDGNGRAQRESIQELAIQVGFAVDWSRVTREQMITATGTHY